MNAFAGLLSLAWLAGSACSASQNGSSSSYLREACSVTLYPDICAHSLSSYSNVAKRSPCRWARAGVSVTISQTKSVLRYLRILKTRKSFTGRNEVALLDCIQCFQDGDDQLHVSLGVLRTLVKTTFEAQMKDVVTWVSAALTNAQTCLDGFDGQKGSPVYLLQGRVQNVTYITSNALALINKLASTGMEEGPNH